MTKTIFFRATLLLALLFGAMSTAWADDRFYIDAVNIEPGETKTLVFNLDNSQVYYGFQADIILPEGVEIVSVNGKPDVKLSDRADDSYSVVTNVLSSGAIRLGTFSTSHSPIDGNTGALLYLKISANTNFTGGTLSIKDILFIDANDRDVQLPDYNMELGNVHNNQFYIPDFRIDVGETKTVTLVLDNETAFSAFQTDLYLPEDLMIIPNSFVLSSRASNNHTVSSKSYGDGRTRLTCFSTNSSVFSGDSGALLSFDITTGKVMNGSCQIELKNQIFSMADAKEFLLPNSVTKVSIGRALVESVKLNKNELTLVSGDSETLTVTVLPLDASTKDVEWSTDNPDIASVSANGLVTAVDVGSAKIRATAVDGSGKFDECVVTVNPIPVKEITLDQPSVTLETGKSLELTYRVLPEKATNKSVIWSTDNDAVASVSENGIISAVNIGTAHVTATAADGFGAKAICTVNVIAPSPTGISIIRPSSVEFKVGQTIELSAVVIPENASDKSVKWSSNDAAIATVNESGVVTAVSEGDVIITATNSVGHSDEITLTVIPTLAESVTVAPEQLTLKIGENMTLTATVSPATTTDKTVVWSSSEPLIAEVNQDGTVRALTTGNAIITATVGKVSAKCFVTVVLPDSIEVEYDDGIIYVIESAKGTAYCKGAPLTKRGPRENLLIRSHVEYLGKQFEVTAIADSAFYFCDEFTGTLTIPETIREIGDLAFYENQYTAKLVIPNSVISIGRGAFLYIDFPEIKLGENLVSIGRSAFGGNIALEEIVIPASVREIGYLAFNYCKALKHLTILSDDLKIGDDAFTQNSSLESIICTSENPPICEYSNYNQLFDNYDCPLYVPANAIEKYKNATEWKKFSNIIALDEEEFTPGDLNGDGVINILDLNKLIYFFTTDDDTDIIADAADVTGDGVVNILDINFLIKLITNN